MVAFQHPEDESPTLQGFTGWVFHGKPGQAIRSTKKSDRINRIFQDSHDL